MKVRIAKVEARVDVLIWMLGELFPAEERDVKEGNRSRR